MIPEAAITFGHDGIDRAEHLRNDTPKLDALRQTAREFAFHDHKLLFDLSGRAPVLADIDRLSKESVFLGFVDGTACFAGNLNLTEAKAIESEQLKWVDLRSIMADLPPVEASLAAAAKGILGWHLSHLYCSNCGEPSEVIMAGWQRKCPACGTHHFPRTDPVVIMLVTSGEQVLLGRSPGWDEGMYSLLAGFMEPGETMEMAVRREVMEEAGIQTGAVRYLASQPWPFSSSLMLACKTEALNTDLTIDPKELEDAGWFTREEIARALIGRHERLAPARRGAIARTVLEHWVSGRV